MKSPDFGYLKARSVQEAVTLLARHGDDARVLAGGQTLLATLNMRLSDPLLLIDITGLDELKGITVISDRLRIGALVTHSEIEASSLVAEHAPMLAAAAPHIAHRAIRNSGTWGGSLAYGDPAAEWPCCLVALEGTVIVRGQGAERRIAAADFYQDLYTTALAPDEIVVAAEVPCPVPGQWFGFDELARRHGDYAVVGLAVSALFEGRALRKVNLAFLGTGTTPIRPRRTESLLEGKKLDESSIEIALASLKSEIEPLPDLHHSTETKRHLATVLARRMLCSAQASRAALSI